MNILVDESMPRSLAHQIASLGFAVQDVRDIGLRGRDDGEVFAAAVASDAIIVTRDRGFTFHRSWPSGFTAGVIFVSLPDNANANVINEKITELLSKRLPVSLLGATPFLALATKGLSINRSEFVLEAA
ncbi:MAG: DUF5615 family PIN-like protein [Acidobacteriota bacterium]